MIFFLKLNLRALKLFFRRKGPTLAAASTFYLILSIIPMSLLLLRGVGFFLGEEKEVGDFFFAIISQIIPDTSPEISDYIKVLLLKPLFSDSLKTLINTFFLIISSLTFFNSIFNGLFLMTGDRSLTSMNKHLKGLLLLILTILLIVSLLGIPALLDFAFELIKSLKMPSLFQETVEEVLLQIKVMADFFSLGWPLYFVFWFWMAAIYCWFLSFKLSFKEALIPAGLFMGSILVGKNIFSIYYLAVKGHYLQNYGPFSAVMLTILWPYLILCCFLIGACLCNILSEGRCADPLIAKEKL